MINPLVLDRLQDVPSAIFLIGLAIGLFLFWYYEFRYVDDPDWNPRGSEQTEGEAE